MNVRRIIKEVADGKTDWTTLGLLEGLEGEAYYYTKYNYDIVAEYILRTDPDDLMIFGKYDITGIIFPIIRRIINYKNWDNTVLQPNYVKIEDPEKFINYVKQLWIDFDAEVWKLKTDRAKHNISIDYEAEMCHIISENINYILKKDENGK